MWRVWEVSAEADWRAARSVRVYHVVFDSIAQVVAVISQHLDAIEWI